MEGAVSQRNRNYGLDGETVRPEERNREAGREDNRPAKLGSGFPRVNQCHRPILKAGFRGSIKTAPESSRLQLDTRDNLHIRVRLRRGTTNGH